MFVQKLSDNVLPKGERDTPIVFAPPVNLLVRIGPEEIAEQTRIRYIRRSDNTFDLIQAGEFRTETTMHAENLFVNDSCRRKAIKAVRESLPELDTKTPFAFVVKAVDTIDGGTLMVSSEHKKVLGILDLVGQKQANGFETLFAAIYVVAEENIVGFRREAAVLKKAQQIVVLSVHVAANLDGGLELQEHGLAYQKISTAQT